jgi:hypothetical protein
VVDARWGRCWHSAMFVGSSLLWVRNSAYPDAERALILTVVRKLSSGTWRRVLGREILDISRYLYAKIHKHNACYNKLSLIYM